MGVSLCDYMNLYKKFLPKSQQSWKLDYIAKNDTGKGKLDYYDMGYESMKEFMQKDFATFTKYNIIDTILVKQIDDKRQFIALMRRICNMGLCEYESIFKSIPYILGALCIEARSQGLKFLTDANKDDLHKNDGAGFTGAFVFPTSRGFYENGIMSFDFNSLYPNVIMSVNMSPETMVGKVVSEIGEKDDDIITIQRVNGTKINVTKQQFDEILEKKCSISANNTLFLKSTNRWGIIPSFLEKLYKNRVNIKNEMKKNKILVKELNEKIKKLKEELMNYEN
jgi:DNA polymerase elongation subunit (family B)